MDQNGLPLDLEADFGWRSHAEMGHVRAAPVPENLINAAVEHSPAGLVVLDADRSVRLVTRAARLLLGCGRQHPLNGWSFGRLLQNCRLLDQDAIRRIWRALDDAQDEPREIVLKCGSAEDVRTVTLDVRSMGSAGWVLSLSDATSTRQAQDWLLEHVSSDPITGLKNRQHLMLMLRDRMSCMQAGSIPDEQPVPSALLIGLQQFRRCVETFGHRVGDAVLAMAGQRLAALLGADDMLAYFGDGHFAIICGLADDEAALACLGAQIITTVYAPFLVEGQSIPLQARIGIATATAAVGTPEELIMHARLALQTASITGQGNPCFFDPVLIRRQSTRRELEIDLQHALLRGEFELFYQPQVDVDRKCVTGLEALIRWRSPTRGLVPPDDFIPLAEQSGLIVQIGDWVLREACAKAVSWPADVTVAVNASPLQFESGLFAQSVANALEMSGLPAGRLEIEVTESLLLRDTGAVVQTLAALRTLGVRLALDDFGTGYASFSQLSRFSFDKIKIDRSFISMGKPSPENGAIVRAIASIGQSLGIPTTAEGVETALQLEQVTASGCTSVQGYFYSRPVPSSDIPGVLAQLNARENAVST